MILPVASLSSPRRGTTDISGDELTVVTCPVCPAG